MFSHLLNLNVYENAIQYFLEWNSIDFSLFECDQIFDLAHFLFLGLAWLYVVFWLYLKTKNTSE